MSTFTSPSPKRSGPGRLLPCWLLRILPGGRQPPRPDPLAYQLAHSGVRDLDKALTSIREQRRRARGMN